jgi:hypothetical protein
MGDGRVLGEVFLGFGGWVRRFWCAFFFPEECMIRRAMNFIFFVEGGRGRGRGWGWGSRGLNRWK